MERIQVVTVPTLPASVIPDEPVKQVLSLPNVLVLNKDEVGYFDQACEEFNAIGQEDAFTREEVEKRYPGLTRGSACDWAIYGFVVQDWLTVESQMADIARYVDELRAQNDFLKDLLETR